MTRPASGDPSSAPAASAQPAGANDNHDVDPQGLIAAVLHDRVETVHPSQANDCLLGWVMDLPDGVDPAAAAAQLLADAPPPRTETARQLIALLSETAGWSRSRLDRRLPRRRRAARR
jgi:hypothetical protein